MNSLKSIFMHFEWMSFNFDGFCFVPLKTHHRMFWNSLHSENTISNRQRFFTSFFMKLTATSLTVFTYFKRQVTKDSSLHFVAKISHIFWVKMNENWTFMCFVTFRRLKNLLRKSFATPKNHSNSILNRVKFSHTHVFMKYYQLALQRHVQMSTFNGLEFLQNLFQNSKKTYVRTDLIFFLEIPSSTFFVL